MVTNLAANTVPSENNRSSHGGLHATVTGTGAPVVLLHGLFGMGSNLGALARALAGDYEVHQLDLPNHGKSPWQSSSSLKDLAAAIARYIDSKQLGSVAVVGHSLGGKVAMQMALDRPDLMSAVVVADIAPVDYGASHEAVFAAIAAVEAARPESRSEAEIIMREFVSEFAVVQFLTLSLMRDVDKTYKWRFNVAALRDNYDEFRKAPRGQPYPGSALFVYGLLSSYVDEAGMAAALQLFPEAIFDGIADTGHWLHAEKPQEFNSVVLDFLNKTLGRKGPQA